MFQDKFKVPSYYKDFHCKGSDCRNCCCQGWKVTLTQDEYFKLLNLDCSKDLKEKIDAYVGILPHPSPLEYARIYFDYTGQCPLRLLNGYCGLQVECGEENIASVCRYYPRSPKLFPFKECCISNSCEWVLERVIEDEDFTFEDRELSFSFDDDEKEVKMDSDYIKNREDCILLMKRKDLFFFDKLSLFVNDKGLISQEKTKEIISSVKKAFSRSISISSYLANIPSQIEDVSFLCVKMKEMYPKLDRYMANILLNHFFYIKFPYVEKCHLKNMGINLYYVVYLWLLILYYNLSKKDENDFIDITGSFFRVLEHSNLYEVIDFFVERRKG